MAERLSKTMDYEHITIEQKRKACQEYIKNNGITDVLKLMNPGIQDVDNIFEITEEQITVKLGWFAALNNYPEELVIPDFVTEVL